ncbi:MAG: type II toxin-antitoxin system VapB family antitoxin [Thermodesulfobacteriota bacterium]
MATNLAIDNELIEKARKIGKHKTKKAVVTEALEEYIQRRKQIEIIDLFGTIDFDPEYDYKSLRDRE